MPLPLIDKLRSSSLLPGTSVLPLLSSALLISDHRCVPILLDSKGTTIGCSLVRDLDTFRASRHFSYTKHDRVRVLIIKLASKGLEATLDLFIQELQKKGKLALPPPSLSSTVTIFDGSNNSLARIPSPLATFIGARIVRVGVVAYTGTGRHCQLLMARRMATCEEFPSRIQCLLSFPHDQDIITREQLAQVAHKSFDLQPAFLHKLRSTGIITPLTILSSGISHIATHCYDLDLTDTQSWKPSAKVPIDAYEYMSLGSILDSCHAGMVYPIDIPLIIDFCLRHGIICPENEQNYALINQILHYDWSRPFPYKT